VRSEKRITGSQLISHFVGALPKYLGSISKRPARFSSSRQYGTDCIFGGPVFGLTGKSKRNLINALK